MKFFKFYKVLISLIVFLFILSLGIIIFYSLFNSNLSKKLEAFDVKIYENKINIAYTNFLEDAKTNTPTKSYNNLLTEVSSQIEIFSKDYSTEFNLKKHFVNKKNKNIINSKKNDLKNYSSKLNDTYKLLMSKDELPKREIPGYFVLMQIMLNDIYNMHLDIQFEYNGEKVKLAFLTFDDGPTKNTKEILEVLESNDVRGTFFLIGNRINLHSKDVQDIINQGSSIAIHSYTHDTSKYEKNNVLEDEMDKTKNILKDDFNYETDLIRIPTGSTILNDTQRKNLEDKGYKIIDWNVDSEDWKNEEKNSNIIYDNVVNNLTKDKEIILFHEKDTTLKVLQDVIDELKSKGYYIVPMPPKHFVSYKFGDI